MEILICSKLNSTAAMRWDFSTFRSYPKVCNVACTPLYLTLSKLNSTAVVPPLYPTYRSTAIYWSLQKDFQSQPFLRSPLYLILSKLNSPSQLEHLTLVDTISSHQDLPHNSHRYRCLSRKFNLIKINSPLLRTNILSILPYLTLIVQTTCTIPSFNFIKVKSLSAQF